MNDKQDVLATNYLFPSAFYFIDQPIFHSTVASVADRYLKQLKSEVSNNDMFPVYQTVNFAYDTLIDDFTNYIALTAWNILNDQGLYMEKYNTHVSEVWAQECCLGSGQSEHVHSNGVQISGFYVIDAPTDSSKFMFHDPRPAKRQINLPEKDYSEVTIASDAVTFTPSNGQFYFFNSFIPHEITRNLSTEPFKFIHFNVSVQQKLIHRTPAPNNSIIII